MPRLTKRFIDSLPESDRDRLYRDDKTTGLALRVKPSGVKTFVLRYRNELGRQRSLALGKYGELTAAEARQLAKVRLAEVRKGGDPSAERQRQRAALTVEELAKVYRRQHLARKKDSTRKRAETSLTGSILPALGKIKCEALTRADVLRFHQKLSETPVEANRSVTLLGGMLRWGEDRELIHLPSGNPCARIRKNPERARRRYLRPEELRAFGAALDEVEREGAIHPSSIRLVRLVLLTGCRIGEIQKLRWTEVDLQAGLLDLGETKTGPRIVHLSTRAVEILREAREATDGEYVCPGQQDQPISYPKRLWSELRRRTSLHDIRPHDLRRTFASIARSQGESLEVAMELLGHSTAEMGDRYAFLWDEKAREASESIGARLAELTESG